MPNYPHTEVMSLTGGATYDELTLPDRVRRLYLKSIERHPINIKFGTMDPLPVDTSEYYDTEWLPSVGELGTVSVNGEGTIAIEYWT